MGESCGSSDVLHFLCQSVTENKKLPTQSVRQAYDSEDTRVKIDELENTTRTSPRSCAENLPHLQPTSPLGCFAAWTAFKFGPYQTSRRCISEVVRCLSHFHSPVMLTLCQTSYVDEIPNVDRSIRFPSSEVAEVGR